MTVSLGGTAVAEQLGITVAEVARDLSQHLVVGGVGAAVAALLVLAAGWHPADSQLARSSKFVPLLYSIMELGREAEPIKAANLVGRPISLPTGEDTAGRLQGPHGKISLPSDGHVFYADVPGLYTLAGAHETTFAVNLPPAESKTDDSEAAAAHRPKCDRGYGS